MSIALLWSACSTWQARAIVSPGLTVTVSPITRSVNDATEKDGGPTLFTPIDHTACNNATPYFRLHTLHASSESAGTRLPDACLAFSAAATLRTRRRAQSNATHSCHCQHPPSVFRRELHHFHHLHLSIKSQDDSAYLQPL
jgi:hypothetical protein